MNIRKGIVSLGAITSVLLAGSNKNAVNAVQHTAPKKVVADFQLKPQPLIDTVKFHTIDYMDDGPVLPSYINKK